MNKWEVCAGNIVTKNNTVRNGLENFLRPGLEDMLYSIMLQMLNEDFLSKMQEKDNLFTITLTVEHTDGSKLEDDNRRLVHNEELQD